ncbi:MAG: hypothetical protein RI907_2667 [Pseudomonadota bacterium]|jgi:hypothetical protein
MSAFPRLAAVTGLLLATAAQAQTHTATLLARPSGASSCYETANLVWLAANGDVATRCDFPQTFQAFFNALTGAGGPVYSSRSVVWRGGSATAKTLSGTTAQPKTQVQGAQADGAILGTIYNSTSSTPSIWRGTTRSNYALPAGYTGWQLERTSRDGQTLLISLKDNSRFQLGMALVKGGVATKLPTPPLACGTYGASAERHQWLLNSQGQVAILRARKVTNALLGYTSTVGKVCLYQSGDWVVSDDTPVYYDEYGVDNRSYGMDLMAFSDSGEVLIDQRGRYTWQPSVGFKQPDAAVVGYGHGSDVLGGTPPSDSTITAEASVWRNGQALPLTAFAPAPAGYRYTTALGTTAAGHILALAVPSSATVITSGGARLVLLKPR